MSAWVKPLSDISVSDGFISDLPFVTPKSEASIPSLEETPISSPKIPPKTSHFLLVYDVSSESSFPIKSDISHSDSKVGIHTDIQPMKFMDSFPQPFHDQNTQQPSSSLVEKSQNCIVSNAMSLVYVSFMSCMYFIPIPMIFYAIY